MTPFETPRFSLPATFIPQAWIDGKTHDIDGALGFEASFYLAQLPSEDVDELCVDDGPLAPIHDDIIEQALEYGSLSNRRGPYRLDITGAKVRAWREAYRAASFCTVGELRGAINAGAQGGSDALPTAIAAAVFGDNEMLPSETVNERLETIARMMLDAKSDAEAVSHE
jgi:hypothetical protein